MDKAPIACGEVQTSGLRENADNYQDAFHFYCLGHVDNGQGVNPALQRLVSLLVFSSRERSDQNFILGRLIFPGRDLHS